MHAIVQSIVCDVHACGVQVIQRDRLVACMLEYIEEEHAGRVRVRHHMQVQELAVQEGETVSLKWSRNPPHSNGETDPSEGVAQTDFLVCFLDYPYLQYINTGVLWHP